jgi:uncharacterized membrane protein (UPF0127 family)
MNHLFASVFVVGMIVLLAAALGYRDRTVPVGVFDAPKISMAIEVADSFAAQAKGLQGHAPLSDSQGMLFRFKVVQIQCVWNHNVSFPVDVGFYDSGWHLLNGGTLKARSDNQVCSKSPAAYVLETQAGWFKTHNFEGVIQ